MKRVVKKILSEIKKFGLIKTAIKVAAYAAYKVISGPVIIGMKKSIKTVKKNRMVFETKPDFADNGRTLFEYLIDNGYNSKYELIFLVENDKKYRHLEKENVKFVKSIRKYSRQRTLRAYYYSLTARYVFFTHAFRWIKQKTKNQIYINLWHGCGYKASRRTEENRNIFDFCLVPGDIFIETKAKFFDEDEKKFLPIGYPRYDLLERDNKQVEKYFNSIKKDKNTRNIVWMPTFRKQKDLDMNEDAVAVETGLPVCYTKNNLKELNEFCKKANVNLIIKKHRIDTHIHEEANEYSNILYLDNDRIEEMGMQLYEFLPKTDALLTDYSSVAIDFLLIDKPIGFTLDDYEDYKNTRGFVFENPLEYMPGHHIFDMDGMKEFINDVANGNDKYKEKRLKVRELAHNTTKEYSKRVLEQFHITL